MRDMRDTLPTIFESAGDTASSGTAVGQDVFELDLGSGIGKYDGDFTEASD